jgi:hypothetical protein
MTVPIHYENVPFFCFICGRLGHLEKECLDGELGDGALNFGAELRASPSKRLREIRVQSKPGAMHFLNFEGPQWARLQEEANSAMRDTNSMVSENQRHSEEEQEEVGDHAHSIPKEEEGELMKGDGNIDVAAVDKKGVSCRSTVLMVCNRWSPWALIWALREIRQWVVYHSLGVNLLILCLEMLVTGI